MQLSEKLFFILMLKYQEYFDNLPYPYDSPPKSLKEWLEVLDEKDYDECIGFIKNYANKINHGAECE